MQTSQETHHWKNSESDTALIRVENVSHVIDSRPLKTRILDTLTFTIPAQTLFAITGPSGSGKSTLLNILTGIDRPTSGRVVFAGELLRAKSESALAKWRGKHVGIVFQFFQLLPTLTALENVLLALELGGGGSSPRRHWRELAMECLDTVGIKEYANRLPSQLSGGQQQRVAIARALANDPPVLIADEPTGNLDSRAAQQVFEILAGLARQGKTIVYVTHDSKLASLSTARIELFDGQIVNHQNADAIVPFDRVSTRELR
ncbi:MAG TPA: ABC transporter ATP-binding protein [Ktedonosporobacter sp.]|nr:ABC transporter ATP-binding protein [Ktedonosporobacter sp.]